MTGEEFSHNARAHEEEEENNSCSRKSNGSYGVEFISSGKVSSSLCLTAPLPFFPLLLLLSHKTPNPPSAPLPSATRDIGKYADQLKC